MKEFYSVTRISAAELADFMGISVRTLQRMDENKTLPANRDKNGRRVYTTEHIRKALEIMEASERRPVLVSFCKTGASSMCGKLKVPRKWLERMGITQESPEAVIRFDGESIIVSKPKGSRFRRLIVSPADAGCILIWL